MRRKDFVINSVTTNPVKILYVYIIYSLIYYIYIYIPIKAHVKCIHLNPANIHVVDICTFYLPSRLSPLDSEALLFG